MNANLIKLIPQGTRRVLETGCADGALGAAIKSAYKGVEFVGLELSPQKAEQARLKLDTVFLGDAEEFELPTSLGLFDCLIYADSIEHMKDPEALLNRHLKYLSEDGVVVVSIPNVRNLFIVDSLLKGLWTYTDWGLLDRTHFHLFTLSEFQALAEKCGLTADYIEPSFRDGDWFQKMHEPGRVEGAFCDFYQSTQMMLQNDPDKCAREISNRYGYQPKTTHELIEFYAVQFHIRLTRTSQGDFH